MEYKFVPSLGNCAVDCIRKRYGSLLKLVMKMQEYKKIDITIIVFESSDVVATSMDGADDFGQWNEGWFTKNNG